MMLSADCMISKARLYLLVACAVVFLGLGVSYFFGGPAKWIYGIIFFVLGIGFVFSIWWESKERKGLVPVPKSPN